MHTGDRLPLAPAEMPLREALLEMTRKGLGMVVVVTPDKQVRGIFTDGDLRRVLDQGHDVRTVTLGTVMTAGGKRVAADALAAEAVAHMEDHKITALLVVDADERLLGIVHMHELLRAGVV